MSNWFDDHVIIMGIGDIDTAKIKEAIKSEFENKEGN